MGSIDLQSQTIVVVEDSSLEAKVYIRLIQQAGYEARHFDNAKNVVDLMDTEGPPAVVLSDINLPDLNGLEFMRKLQAHPEWCVVPAILMTSDPTRDQLLLARKLRVPPEGFLVKPVKPTALEEILKNLIAKSHPIYMLRHLQRQRLSHELLARTKDRDLGVQIQEAVKVLEETAKERDGLNRERKSTRDAMEKQENAEEQTNLKLKLDDLQQQEYRVREQLKGLQERRVDLQTQRKRLVGEIDRVLKLLDAQIRTAEDVVRHRVA